MTWFRLPLFVWAHYATSLIMILGTPVVAITILLLAFERVLRVGIFDPSIGGDPVLFQHLFWFYSHPAVYIMVLPGMGVISELIACVLAQERLRLQLRRLLEPGHRDHRLPGLGPPHVRRRARRRTPALVFSIITYLVGGALGGQDVQLDRDALQGLDLLRHADALRVRVHRPVPDRRPDRPVPGGHRPRHARARHLLRRRALPLHHGGRHADGVSRRHPLLVAEDHRPALSGGLGEAERAASSSSAST